MPEWLLGITDKAVDIGVRLLLAVIILLVGRKLVKWLVKKLQKTKMMQRLDVSVSSFLSSAIRITINALLIMSIAVILGVPAAMLVAAIGSVGLAIGLALQGSLANLAGSLMILIFRPFKVGDFIENGSVSGTVESISIFYTVLKTADNKQITCPNGALSNGNITNYSTAGQRRLDMRFCVAADSDIALVKELLLACAGEHELALRQPAPFARLAERTENGLEFVLRVWCESGDYWTLHFDLLEQVSARLAEQGIVLPRAQVVVHPAAEQAAAESAE